MVHGGGGKLHGPQAHSVDASHVDQVVKHDQVRALGPHVTMVGSQELVADVAAAHVAVVKDDGG